MSEALLRVDDLKTHFFTDDGVVRAVDGVSFELRAGETLAVVGESGSGKSVTALSILRLVPQPPGRIVGGRMIFRDRDLLALRPAEMRQIRGKEISMIFQEPMTSLNPVYTIGNQIAETIRCHKNRSRSEALEEAVEMLRVVQIPAPERRVREYPHQLSGGMRQRVMIAMALACEPNVLIADEPTTALDVTVQAQIFDLLKEIQETRGTCIILITHDFGAVAEMADRVIVMYAGHKIEEGTVDEVRNDARHPYTQGLLRCMPEIQIDPKGEREPLPEIPGTVPDLLRGLKGCPFSPRCSFAISKCKELPPYLHLGCKRSVKCWLAREDTRLKEPA